MHRKIELQAPADFTYLYANTVTLSRQKLDLHLPPSATANDTANDAPDPMRERVRELVDEYITKTFTIASNSININGLDDHDHDRPHLALNPATASESLHAPAETVEYEPFDTALAARVTSLYAQLESLTTTVAQLRRDAPRRAARMYAEELNKELEGDDEIEEDEEEEFGDLGKEERPEKKEDGGDVEMADAVPPRQRRQHIRPEWKIEVPFGSEQETERWRSGEMAEVYDDALRTLLRLQGEDTDTAADAGTDGNALATTVGKAERAERAAEVVEKM